MALTAVLLQRIDGVGPASYRMIKVTGDASYPTGGYAVTPALFGLTRFESDGLGSGLAPALGSYSVVADLQGNPYSAVNPANNNLQLFVATTGVEVTSGTSETGTSVLLEALGE